jgi:hypothetical protein
MKTKIFSILMMFLLICGFTTAQQKYPIQTIFKGDSVVILKVSQALEINDLIHQQDLLIHNKDYTIKNSLLQNNILKDNVKDLKWKLNVTEADLTRKLTKTQDTLQITRTNLQVANDKIAFYQNEMKRIEKLEWIEKKTRTQMKVGLAGVIVTWIVLVVASVK